MPALSAHEVEQILETNCNITCLALVPSSRFRPAPATPDEPAEGMSFWGGLGMAVGEAEGAGAATVVAEAGGGDVTGEEEDCAPGPSAVQLEPDPPCNTEQASSIMQRYPCAVVITSWQLLEKVPSPLTLTLNMPSDPKR